MSDLVKENNYQYHEILYIVIFGFYIDTIVINIRVFKIGGIKRLRKALWYYNI